MRFGMINQTVTKTKRPQSIDHALSVAAIIMMASVLLSKVIGLIREMILAKYGGTTYEMDAYVTSFIIPEMLNHFLAGGFLSLTFIPIFQKYLAEGRENDAWKSFSNLLNLGTLVFLIAIPTTMFLAPDVLMLLGPHIRQSENHELTVRLTRIILPAQLFFYWGAFFSAVQMAQKRFFLPALAPLGYNGGIIVGGMILGPRFGIEGFAWGVVAGAFIGNIAIQLPGAIKAGMRFQLHYDIRHPDVKLYIVKTLPLILGLGMSFSTEFFFRFFGSYLSEGGTSSVNYALRTMMIVVAVFGQASGVAFFPFLSRLAVENKFNEMTKLLNTILNKIALYLIPISALLIVLSRQIISLLYERGKFDAQSTAETAAVFTIYCLGSFAYSASIIISRSFYAMQNMLLPMTVNTGVALGIIPLYIYMISIAGTVGIAIAAITGMTIQFIIFYAFWNKRYGSLQKVKEETMQLLKITAISSVAAGIGSLLLQWLEKNLALSNHTIQNGMEIAAVSLLVLTLQFFLYDILGIQKIADTLREFTRRKQ
jgi:putative peptidoglycan lipid II flippase